MAKRDLKIHIAAEANLTKIREVNNELAKMAASAGRSNGDLRNATLQAARAYYDLGDAADKAASRSVLSAKQIEEAWRKAMKKPTDDAARGFGRLSEIANGALKGIGGAFAGIGRMFVQGGVWGAMAAAATKAFTLIWDYCQKASERAAKRVEYNWKESLSAIKDGAGAVEKAFDRTNTAIDQAISKFAAMTNSVKELTKAEIELAKQQAIANGMDAASANAAATDLSAQVDYEAERARLEKVIELERKRADAAAEAEAKAAEYVKAAAAKKAEAEAELERKREEYVKKHSRTEGTYTVGMVSGAVITNTITAEEARRSRETALVDFNASDDADITKLRDRVRDAQSALDAAKANKQKDEATAADALAKISEAQRAIDTIDTKHAARAVAVENEIAAKVEEDRKKQAEADRAAAEKAAAEEVKLAEKVAKERERLDAQEAVRRERERQAELAAKIKDHQKLLDAERREDAASRSKIAAAESKMQQAWGWYRNKDSMAAQLAEEKADAEARRQYEKDFARLKDRHRDWRRADNLSVDEEAVRRVALAREKKEAAEKHLAEIEKNTADLAAKLDKLLQVKG